MILSFAIKIWLSVAQAYQQYSWGQLGWIELQQDDPYFIEVPGKPSPSLTIVHSYNPTKSGRWFTNAVLGRYLGVRIDPCLINSLGCLIYHLDTMFLSVFTYHTEGSVAWNFYFLYNLSNRWSHDILKLLTLLPHTRIRTLELSGLYTCKSFFS